MWSKYYLCEYVKNGYLPSLIEKHWLPPRLITEYWFFVSVPFITAKHSVVYNAQAKVEVKSSTKIIELDGAFNLLLATNQKKLQMK